AGQAARIEVPGVVDRDRHLVARRVGQVVALDALHPLEAAAREAGGEVVDHAVAPYCGAAGLALGESVDGLGLRISGGRVGRVDGLAVADLRVDVGVVEDDLQIVD